MNQIYREEAVESSEAEQSPISPAPGRAEVGRGKGSDAAEPGVCCERLREKGARSCACARKG
jgi:hypothetical protein